MIIEPKISAILSKILSKEKLTKIEKKLIYKKADGSYNLFNKYSITQQDSVFVLNKTKTFTIHIFAELRNAVAWSTFDLQNNILAAQRIKQLDDLLFATQDNIKVHERLAKRTKTLETKLIYLTKFQEDKIKESLILEELSSFVDRAKTWQYKQFTNSIK